MKWTKDIANLMKAKRQGIVENEELSSNSTQQNEFIKLPVNFYIKALVIADGHGCLEDEEIPDENVDVCLLLGDLSLDDIAIVKNRVRNIPTYGILGNHDGFDLYEKAGIENIHGRVVEVNKIKIAGFQGSFRYKNSNFPFFDDNESVEIADQMPAADILISHDSPKYFHGVQDYAHNGLQGITHYCEKHSVPINIHGHFHENGSGYLGNGTFSICCYKVGVVTITPNETHIKKGW